VSKGVFRDTLIGQLTPPFGGLWHLVARGRAICEANHDAEGAPRGHKPEGRRSPKGDLNQWIAGCASSHCVRLSALRAAVEPRSEELKTIRLRHHDFLLDTRIFSGTVVDFWLCVSIS
jgi:hypothetical protein